MPVLCDAGFYLVPVPGHRLRLGRWLDRWQVSRIEVVHNP